MIDSINFSFTKSGQAALFNDSNTGTSLDLTHVQIGSGNKLPDGKEVALIEPKQTVTFADGSQISETQIRMSAVFGGPETYEICEVGLWSGDPSLSTSVLVAYWSQDQDFLAVKSSGVDFIFFYEMALNTDVPAGSINILIDPSQGPAFAGLREHQLAFDPHPQYTTPSEVMAIVEARMGDYVNAGGTPNCITASLVPPITSYDNTTAFAFKACKTNTDSITLDAGGGAKPLLRDDGSSMQAGDVVAGMVITVVYDVATQSFVATEIVASQVNALVEAKVLTHKNDVDPHPQYTTADELAAAISAANPSYRMYFFSQL